MCDIRVYELSRWAITMPAAGGGRPVGPSAAAPVRPYGTDWADGRNDRRRPPPTVLCYDSVQELLCRLLSLKYIYNHDSEFRKVMNYDVKGHRKMSETKSATLSEHDDNHKITNPSTRHPR